MQKCRFKIPKIHLIILHAEACQILNNSSLLTGLKDKINLSHIKKNKVSPNASMLSFCKMIVDTTIRY